MSPAPFHCEGNYSLRAHFPESLTAGSPGGWGALEWGVTIRRKWSRTLWPWFSHQDVSVHVSGRKECWAVPQWFSASHLPPLPPRGFWWRAICRLRHLQSPHRRGLSLSLLHTWSHLAWTGARPRGQLTSFTQSSTPWPGHMWQSGESELRNQPTHLEEVSSLN